MTAVGPPARNPLCERDCDPGLADRGRPHGAACARQLCEIRCAHHIPRQCLPGAGARSKPLRHLLDERKRPVIPVRRHHRAYQLRTLGHLWQGAISSISPSITPPKDDRVYSMSDDDILAFSLEHIRRSFPTLIEKWIPGTTSGGRTMRSRSRRKGYADLVPARNTPLGISDRNHGQIYPEDRGTNLAIRDGREVGAESGCGAIKSGGRSGDCGDSDDVGVVVHFLTEVCKRSSAALPTGMTQRRGERLDEVAKRD